MNFFLNLAKKLLQSNEKLTSEEIQKLLSYFSLNSQKSFEILKFSPDQGEMAQEVILNFLLFGLNSRIFS